MVRIFLLVCIEKAQLGTSISVMKERVRSHGDGCQKPRAGGQRCSHCGKQLKLEFWALSAGWHSSRLQIGALPEDRWKAF